MRPYATTISPSQPHPDLLHRLFFVQQVCLALLVQIAGLALCARPFPALAHLLPISFCRMQTSFAVAALCAALSVFFSDLDTSLRSCRISRIFACFAAAAAMMSFLAPAAAPAHGLTFIHDGPHVLTGAALILISIVLLLLRSPGTAADRAADIATFCLCFLALVQLANLAFGLSNTPGSSLDGLDSMATLACLAMLTLVIVLRRAEQGAFRIFLGSGMGGRIARVFLPIFFLMPLFREAGRAHLLAAHLVPLPYSTAIFSSIATSISFGLLLFLVATINKMENEVHELTLRDELTGLYNMRGFNLLAGQCLRLAQRAEVPFSVLFIDLDNLKRVNDELGHTAGSASLSETARLLGATFREADVIARIGGDEFVVAGQFDQEAVAASARRLQELAACRFSDAAGRFPLSLSVGYATSTDLRFDSLKELIDRADHAMYEKKRRKKLAAL